MGIRDTARRLKVLPLGSSIAQKLEEISAEEMFPVPNRQPDNGKIDQPWTRGDAGVPPASQRRSSDPPGLSPSTARAHRDARDNHHLNTIMEHPELPAQDLISLYNPPGAPCLSTHSTIAFADSALSGPDLTRAQWGSTNAMSFSTAGTALSGYTSSSRSECPDLNVPQWGSLQDMARSAAEDRSCDFELRPW